MRTSHLLAATAAMALMLPAAAKADIFVGHLADMTGATAAIGTAYAQGVADTLEWVNAQGGVAGTEISFETYDYAYQAPRSVSAFQRWTSGQNTVAIQGWGTADTEALIDFVTRAEVPYISASYSGALTDPTGTAPRATKGAPYNFFYGPSYSDACRALVQWAADDWAERGEDRAPRWVHIGANHPYPNSPKEACREYAQELGFEVLDEITYSLAPEDFTPQCLTLNQNGADYAYIANTTDSTVPLLNSCAIAGTDVQFVANVWGYDEEVMRTAGENADGVVFAVRTGSSWLDHNEGMDTVREISGMSDASGDQYRQLSYISGVCSAMYMIEAMEWAAENGGITGPNIRQGFYAKSDWVPAGMGGVCYPSTFTPEDHRGLMSVAIYRGSVSGDTGGRSLSGIFDDGVASLEEVAVIELPRRPEWLGY